MQSKGDIINNRCERKYIVNTIPKENIELIIRNNPILFSEIFYERKINNIYFDTYNFKCYSENTGGSPKRSKIRIRWYGETFGEVEGAILEFKNKTGLVGSKPSYKIDKFIFDKSITNKNLHDIIRSSSLPENIVQILNKLEPKLVNSYWRKYFLSRNKKFRLTLDSDLKYYRIRNCNNFIGVPIRDSIRTIVELKYEKADEDQAYNVTKYLPFRLSKVSKYINGIEYTLE